MGPGLDKRYLVDSKHAEDLHHVIQTILLFLLILGPKLLSSIPPRESDQMRSMAVHLVAELVVLMLFQPWLITKAVAQQNPNLGIAKPNCSDSCGNVSIPYPFGIESGCYMNEWFRVTCNKDNIDGDPKPFITSINLELLNVSISLGTVLVSNPVSEFNCSKKDNTLNFSISLEGSKSPFFFSSVYNRIAAVGCSKWLTIAYNESDVGGCLLPVCNSNSDVISSCHITIPPALTSFDANMSGIPWGDNGDNSTRCGSAFIIADAKLDSDGNVPIELRKKTHVPAVLQWGLPKPSMCNWKRGSNRFCDDQDGYCWANLSSTHFCVCSKDYEDDTQLSDGCRASDICFDRKHRFCEMLCLTTPGKFDCQWPCPDGYEGYPACYPKDLDDFFGKHSRLKAIIIGCSTGIGSLVLLIGSWWFWKVANRRKIKKLKQKYFKRNGGLLLQQKLSSREGSVEFLRLFTSEELENATDNFNQNRILGQGGQGTVYKGMLADGSIVAIKKPKMVGIGTSFNEYKLQQFINEMIILTQINHRNIVKLLGCCLETDVPLLVYEFVINGTLSQHIHEDNEELFPLRWEMRQRIAAEVANALAYLHSSASAPIYHRDIKSSNILLDDKYRAKVSDFGTSRSIDFEQTHLTTKVQGTFGYLDPEYFRLNRFTEKSDVYSFGVVLVELLTGQKPLISTDETEEVKNLVSCFLHSMKEKSLFDILDQCVMKDGSEDAIIAVAKLAKRCLNLNGKKRPTMKEVAMELEMIRASKEYQAIQKDDDDEDSDIDDRSKPWIASSTNSNSSIIWSLLNARP